MKVLRPRSIEDALALRSRTDAPFSAGVTAFQVEWARGVRRPDALIDVCGIAALCGWQRDATAISLGATVTLAAIARDRDLAMALPLLADAIAHVGAPAVRTLATIGGNIGWRAGCLVPALLALDAHVVVSGRGGEHDIPLEHWLSSPPGEGLILRVIVPVLPDKCVRIYRKVGLRAAFSPAAIDVAGVLIADGEHVTQARLAVGGGPVSPMRLPRSEARLIDRDIRTLDRDGIVAGLEAEIIAPDDPLRTGAWRRAVAAATLVDGLFPSSNTRPDRKRFVPGAGAPTAELRLERSAAPRRWHRRPDLPDRIAGRFRYMTDARREDLLVGRILRAGVPHARILTIDTRAAEALSGVATVVTHRDVPGQNAFGIVIQDQPAFCHDKVRYAGDCVAAVAAVDEATAAAALALIRVAYEPLPVVDDPARALASGVPEIHAGGNLLTTIRRQVGDVAAAFATAAHVVEDVYETPRQMHGFMETEGGFAEPLAGGGVAVHAGGQHGGRDRMQLSRILALPEEAIRVVTSPTGGAFGGKDELTVQPALALLALKSGRPVRLTLDRAESVLAGTKRHPFTIRMKTACDADGRLLAQQVEALADAGAYASLGPGVIETAMEHACGPYMVPHVSTLGRLVYTNNGVCGAFRGFGANQMTYAIECQIDRLAARVGLDPVEMRRRNLRVPGMPGPLGQAVAGSERLAEMLDASASSALWNATAPLVGTGLALNHQGNGLGTLPHDVGAAELRLAADGAIEACYGLDDIGQGLAPAIRGAVAEALGCGRADVRVVFGDTAATPDSGSTTAARGMYVVWKGARETAPGLAAALIAIAAARLNEAAEALVILPGGVGRPGANRPLLGFAELAAGLPAADLPRATATYPFPKSDYTAGNARYIFAFGATLARVAISPLTGEVRVTDLELHTAAGPVVDLAAYLGQIEGGAGQGLGFTLSEDTAMRDGLPLSMNLDGYLMPTIADAPERIAVFALEELDDGDPFGPRGAGEIGIGAVTPAIANAIADATGWWPTRTPIRPEDVLSAIRERAT